MSPSQTNQQESIAREILNNMEENFIEGIFNNGQVTTNLFDEFTNIDLLDTNDEINNLNDLQGDVEMMRIMAWNASGLSNNLDSLIRRMKNDEVHLAIVTETWYHPDRHIPDICVHNSLGAVTPNLNRGTNGVSIVINPDFLYDSHVKNIACWAKDTVNGCFIVFEFAGLKIVGIYNAPSHPLNIDELLDEIVKTGRISPGEPVIFAGDFNARRTEWADTTSNSAGRKLIDWMDNWNLERFDTGPTPTCVTARGQSIVDHVFSNLPELVAEVKPSPVPLSDHRPILFEFAPRIFNYERPDRSYMRIKKEELRDKETRLYFGLQSMSRRHLLQDCTDELERSINAARNANDKQQAIDISDKTFCNFFLNLGKDILGETRAGKRKIEYKALSSPQLEVLYFEQELEPSVERAKLISNELCRLKRERFEDFAEKLSNKPPSDVLKIVAQINVNRRARSSALQDTSEALADYANYFATMTTNSLPVPEDIDPPLSLQYDANENRELADTIFTTSKILNILEDVPWNKAAGKSGVCYDLLKAADLSVISSISLWFRIIFCAGQVPLSWTRSIIVPVPKKGNLNEIKNYRPISLTESFRKIFEHCLARFLTVAAGPMHFSQGGFRSDHCCSDMIATLHEVLHKKKNIHVAFLDIKAAYDSVDRTILWNRCRGRGFSDGTIRILKRLFDHNSAQVAINGKRSQPFGIRAGLLQGSVLSPFLYSVFIDDLAKQLTREEQVEIGNFSLNCTMYADDIAIFATTAGKLQALLEKCSRHAQSNRYQFNVSKCTIIGDASFEYKIDGCSIPVVDSFIYLGVEMKGNGIDFQEFVKRRCKTAVDAGMKLVAMGMNLGGFSPALCSMLYKIFIRSKLEAGSCLIPQNDARTKKYEAAQRTILARFFFCSKNSSGTIVRSLMNAPRMAFRQKYLRSRYVHRTQELGASHIVNKVMNSPRNFLKTLEKKTFGKDECSGNGRGQLKHSEMVEVNAETCIATEGHLRIAADGKIPWFLRTKFEPILRKRICHWLLKKYPPHAPRACGRCNDPACSQRHVADCTGILSNICPNIPARFRPEHLLSDPSSNLRVIGQAIQQSIGRCLPHLRLL
jgi:hypothetical protein